MSEFVEIPASKLSLSMRRKIYGIGTNDADYITQPKIYGRSLICPYYRVWTSMLSRCYSPKLHARRPTYKDCSITKDWLIFSVFRKWMKTQDWEGKELDKDILISGNKEYSPNACLFVSGAINNLLGNNAATRGSLPQGVCFNKVLGKYQANCNASGKIKYLGIFTTIPEAEYAYLTFKAALIDKAASEQEALENPRLQAALVRHSEAFKQKANDLPNPT